MISISKAGIASIPIIRELALATWPVTYKGIISAAQIEYMLDMMYSEIALSEQMQNKKHSFLIAFDGNIAVGYCSYSPKMMNNIESGSVYRLHKLYVAIDQQGKGIGKLLLDAVINDIKPTGVTELELNVNKQNPAIHFYKKTGFEIIREEMLDIGNGFFMDDYVMQKKI